jgi:hypothetical protein
MPPKKKTLQQELKSKGKLKLLAVQKEREKLKLQKKQVAEEKKNKIPKKYAPAIPSNISTKGNEEKARREFLEKAGKLDKEKLKGFFTAFIAKNPTESRRNFVSKLGKLHSTLIYKFIDDFLSTPLGVKSLEYLNGFLRSDEVMRFYEDIDLKKKLETQKVPKKMTEEEMIFAGEVSDIEESEEEDLFGDSQLLQELEGIEEEDEMIFNKDLENAGGYNKYKKTDKRAKMVDLSEMENLQDVSRMKTIDIPVAADGDMRKYMKSADNKCLAFYRASGWLDKPFEKIWISPSSDSIEPEKYYISTEVKEINGKNFYRASLDFIISQCTFFGKRSDRYYDSNGYLVVNNKTEKTLKFQVYFELPGGELIKGTQELLDRENELYKESKGGVQKVITTAVNRTLNSLSRSDLQIVRNIMEEQVKSYIPAFNEPKKLADIFVEKNGKNSLSFLFREFAAFLSMFSGELREISQVFNERVKVNYYSPTELSVITVENVLPEVFLDGKVKPEDKNIIRRYLQIQVENIYMEMVYSYYYILHPEARRSYITGITSLDYSADKNALKNICMNDISGIDPFAIYFFKKDSGEYYCFNLNDLDNQLSKFTEPIPEDIKREMYEKRDIIKKSYENIPKHISIETEKVQTEEELKISSMTDLLLSTVMNDILDCEEEIGKKGERYSNLLKRGKKLPRGVNLQERIDKICEYCKKAITTDSPLSSVIKRKEGSVIVKFCDTHCFESMEKWPRNRGKKDKILTPPVILPTKDTKPIGGGWPKQSREFLEDIISRPERTKKGTPQKISREYLSDFYRENLDSSIDKDKFIDYILHIHAESRPGFIKKLLDKSKKDRIGYLNDLLDDSDLDDLEEEIYSGDSNSGSESSGSEGEFIKKQHDLYDFSTDGKSLRLIYQAFLQKIGELPMEKRRNMYKKYSRINTKGKDLTSEIAKKQIFSGFEKYLKSLNREKQQEFIDNLFYDKFVLE